MNFMEPRFIAAVLVFSIAGCLKGNHSSSTTEGCELHDELSINEISELTKPLYRKSFERRGADHSTISISDSRSGACVYRTSVQKTYLPDESIEDDWGLTMNKLRNAFSERAEEICEFTSQNPSSLERIYCSQRIDALFFKVTEYEFFFGTDEGKKGWFIVHNGRIFSN